MRHTLKMFWAVLRGVFLRVVLFLCKVGISLRWKVFFSYYVGLGVQARYLYRQSRLFKDRWQEMGLEFAEGAFENDKMYFFGKAKREPFCIRAQIFLDTVIVGREPRPYYIEEK